MTPPDVVYLVRPGNDNEELRYSLRSLNNLPHRRVWLAGHQPPWTRNVGRIPVAQDGGKWDNQHANLTAACSHPDVADQLVLFNDDFFVTDPLDQVPVLHRGPFGDLERTYLNRYGEYARRMVATARILGRDALAYDAIHTPLPIVKRLMSAVLDGLDPWMLFRSVYANRNHLGGGQADDVKVTGMRAGMNRPLTSTSDRSFARGEVGRQLRAQFPHRSRYEETT